MADIELHLRGTSAWKGTRTVTKLMEALKPVLESLEQEGIKFQAMHLDTKPSFEGSNLT